MDASQEVELQSRGNNNDNSRNQVEIWRSKNYTWWFRISLYIVFLVAGQSAATMLGRLYYDKGGNSKWMATLVQSAGFPILIPLLFLCPRRCSTADSSSSSTPPPKHPPRTSTMLSLYVFFGLLLAGDNMMYSYGLLYIPVSTYSLLCATQLAFNGLFSFLINAQKFTALILNSLVLLTVSAALLAVHAEADDGAAGVSKGRKYYAIGFLCTVGASATYSLYLSLMELSFKKVIGRETFGAVVDMQVFPSSVASCLCVVGLFASGEWRGLEGEMSGFEKGRVAYVMTLVWTAVSWQICSVGLLGLIFEVSSLFSNVISTLGLPSVPFLAVIFFGDKMDGVKVIALLLAIWGFLSYIYQHYLDDSKGKSTVSSANQV